MKTIGTTKVLRNGRKIEFRRANPTSVFNALDRHFSKCGYEIYDRNIARTGSRYLVAENDELVIELRSSNHTDGSYFPEFLEFIIYNGKIGSVKMDLSVAEVNSAEAKKIIAEIEDLNKNGLPPAIFSDDYNERKAFLETLKASEWVKSALLCRYISR